jgi:DNA-binding NtrC family response regulator
VELVADRFMRLAPAFALDLATGRRVRLSVRRIEDRAAQARWADDCASALIARQPGEFPLIDFGVYGNDGRFEARACEPWTLAYALRIEPPAVLQDFCALLDEASGAGSGPATVAVCGPPGAGKSTLIELAAREARTRGFIPVATRLLAAWARAGETEAECWRGLVSGRQLFIVHDELDARGAGGLLVRALVLAGVVSARSHVIVLSGEEQTAAATIGLGRLSMETLVRMVRVDSPGPRWPSRVARAARQADGLPGLFVRELDRLARGLRGGGCEGAMSMPTMRVAERAPVYHVEQIRDSQVDATLRRVDELLARGRHAAAERHLRATLAMAERRGRDEQAGDAALRLGRLLLARGRAANAAHCFDLARRAFDRTDASAGCVRAAVWQALAWTDDGRLREAESLLKAVLCAVDQVGDRSLRVGVHLALARSLFWQARYQESRLTLAAVAPDPELGFGPVLLGSMEGSEPDLLVRWYALAVCAAIGEQTLAHAAAHARSAQEAAARVGRPWEMAIACLARAFVSLRLGELDGVRTSVDLGLRAAVDARAPLLAIRLRVIDALASTPGDPANAARVARLQRLSRQGLPALLRAQVVTACARFAPSEGQEVSSFIREHDRFVGVSGALALSLFEPPAGRRDGLVDARAGAGAHVLDLLDLCRRADDERTALAGAAGFVRERLNATAVGVFARTGERTYPVAWTGSRAPTTALAQRAADLGQPLPPAPAAGGTEMAVPITCGDIVGAMTCRWALDVRVDAPAASELLTAVAAAVALHVRLAGEALQPQTASVEDPELLGTSGPMIDLRQAIARAARTPFSVLVEGESGSGKELVARAIHRMSARRLRKFCCFNCAALPDDLLEAELFGHARGAFTSAVADRAGLFEQADGGTLLMDEVGELSPRAQAKLLRVVQDGEIRRLGDAVARQVDVRIVAATNRSLRDESSAGRFRRDLLYRLDVIRIVVPPLRDRLDDIPQLAAHFWRRAAERTGSRATLAASTIAALARYDWPGNVRELQNVLAALAATAPPRGRVSPEALPASLLSSGGSGPRTLEEARRAFDTRFVRMALARAGGRRTQAAADLGLTRQGLAKLIDRLGIEMGEELGG